jgi:hypothetical protein
MRTTLLACCGLTVITATANAQTTCVGPWQPRPSIGLAFGALDYDLTNDRTNRLLSGTIDIPFSDEARVRIVSKLDCERVVLDLGKGIVEMVQELFPPLVFRGLAEPDGVILEA